MVLLCCWFLLMILKNCIVKKLVKYGISKKKFNTFIDMFNIIESYYV